MLGIITSGGLEGLNDDEVMAGAPSVLMGVDVFCNDLIKSSKRFSASSVSRTEKNYDLI